MAPKRDKSCEQGEKRFTAFISLVMMGVARFITHMGY